MKFQGRSVHKFTGGRLKHQRGKRKFELGRESSDTHLADTVVRKKINCMGGNVKLRLYRGNIANITDPATKKTKTAKIITVTGNPANVHYVRRNMLTKGAIIKTEMGAARITNRPGQDGVVNAVLIEKA